MTTPRKKAPRASQGTSLTAAQLAEFLGGELDGAKEQIDQALKLSIAAAERFTGRPVPNQMPHNLAHGIRLLAASLLLRNRLEEPVADSDIPMLARYHWKLEG
jgi:hypothetical protein